MHPQAIRVMSALKLAGCDAEVREMPDSTHTAVEAAQAIGCEVAQIVKSVIFVLVPPGELVLVLASGINRVDEKLLGAKLGGRLNKATANQVQAVTGYTIGGVPPLGHATRLATYIDEDLLRYDVVWAAAGTPHAVFPIEPGELVRVTEGKVMTIH